MNKKISFGSQLSDRPAGGATIVFKKPFEVIIEQIKKPQPLEGQLLLKTVRTMISIGTELTVLMRDKSLDNTSWAEYGKFPFTPGYNNIGIVIDVGAGVEKSWIGKKVATYGTHSQFTVCDKDNARIIHREINDDHAIFFTIAEIVMNGIRRGGVKWSDSVAIYGLGLLGQLAVRICKFCGAKPIFALDISKYRLDRVPRNNRIIPINSKKENVFQIIKNTTRERMVDVVVEVTGTGDIVPMFEILRDQGKFIILSSPRKKTLFDFNDLCNYPSYTIIGAHNRSHPPLETLDNPWTMKRDAELFFDLIADEELDMEALISSRVHYTEAVGIYNKLIKDRSKEIGILLNWD